VIGPLLLVCLVVAVVAAMPALRSSRQRRARAQALADALPGALDSCAVVLGAGGTIADALSALATSGPEPLRTAAVRARARSASGARLDDALRWLQAELGPPAQPLTGALLLAREQGGPVGLTLARLASEATGSRRRQGELRARRLPVALLVPLVTCSLPAVILGAVVPLAVVALRQVRL
jgi:tight adherence protein C